METFTASQSGDRHPTDLAMLNGARMVCASETEEGRAWAEVRIKQMTGNDVIAARFMRQDFFEYRPQFKLTIIGNHKPSLRNVDDAVRRRFNIVPFEFKPNPVDPHLEDKLRAEWPGILRWMIEGCLDWQRNGLLRPASGAGRHRRVFRRTGPFRALAGGVLYPPWHAAARSPRRCCTVFSSGAKRTASRRRTTSACAA